MALSDLIDYPAFAPVEDLLLGILRPLEAEIAGLKVRSLIEPDDSFSTPYVLVRRESGAYANNAFGNDESRFLIRAVVHIESFTDDPNGDQKGAVLQEVLRRRLVTAWRRQIVIPQAGSISSLRPTSPPHRAADWATSTGVVQYATLPKNLHRYEAIYGLSIRPDLRNPPDPLSVLN